MPPMPELWNFRQLLSKQWPVVGDLAVHTPAEVNVDLKPDVGDDFLAQLFLRVQGNIVKTGAGPGSATGRENPEALVRYITARPEPALSAFNRNSLTARGLISMGMFDRGYSIRATDLTDTAETIGVDFILPLISKQPGSVQPVEWSFPMHLFRRFALTVNCGGREQLFSGGTNTWDLTGLLLEVWADLDRGMGGQYHLVETFEQTVPITATQADKKVDLESGWLYTHLLLLAQRDDVLVDDLINNVHVYSGGRVWTPRGQSNRGVIQRWNRETHINSAAESLTGLVFIPMLRDGMITRAIDAGETGLTVMLDVTSSAGVEMVTLHGRRIRPKHLKV